MDFFLLKKILSALVMPLSLILILMLLSLIFHKTKPRLSFKFLLISFLLLFISAMPPISNTFMTAIEDNFEPFTRSDSPVDYIVVLGGWHQDNAALPITSQLNVNSLQRVVEALRIAKIHPEAKIITSGFSAGNDISNAEAVKQSLVLLGVPASRIITENFPKDTQEEAVLISQRVQGFSVVLITNADHMLRSVKYFKTQGINVIPAPTGYWVKNPESNKNWSYYLPNSKKLQQTTIAWYETLGLFVQWLKSFF